MAVHAYPDCERRSVDDPDVWDLEASAHALLDAGVGGETP